MRGEGQWQLSAQATAYAISLYAQNLEMLPLNKQARELVRAMLEMAWLDGRAAILRELIKEQLS